MAKGDLTQRIESNCTGTFGELRDHANQTIDSLVEIVQHGDDRAERQAPGVEPQDDVERDQHERDRHRHDRGIAQLVADLRAHDLERRDAHARIELHERVLEDRRQVDILHGGARPRRNLLPKKRLLKIPPNHHRLKIPYLINLSYGALSQQKAAP